MRKLIPFLVLSLFVLASASARATGFTESHKEVVGRWLVASTATTETHRVFTAWSRKTTTSTTVIDSGWCLVDYTCSTGGARCSAGPGTCGKWSSFVFSTSTGDVSVVAGPYRFVYQKSVESVVGYDKTTDSRKSVTGDLSSSRAQTQSSVGPAALDLPDGSVLYDEHAGSADWGTSACSGAC